MHEQQRKFLWVLPAVGAVLALILTWSHFRAEHDPGADAAQVMSDTATAPTDPDDILVDLKDNASPAQIAAIERDLGIDLVLVSDQSLDERFYRAHVDASQRDAVLAALEARPEVEIAEPDSYMQLFPQEMT